MLGKPKFNYGDSVTFELDGKPITGVIYIVDEYGTFEDNSDVSYDIMVDECEKYPEGCLFKHISEKYITYLN